MHQDNVILCVSSKYEEKYYLNEDFENGEFGMGML